MAFGANRKSNAKQINPFSRIVLLVLLIGGLVLGIKNFSAQSKEPTVANAQGNTSSPAAATIAPSPTQSPTVDLDSRIDQPLDTQVNAILQNVQGTFGIAVKNLTTGEVYFKNENEPFLMASTYKTPLVIAALQEEENGNYTANTMVGAYNLDFSLNQIITISNEDAAEILAGMLGWPKVQQASENLGMRDTDYTSDFTTTPKDQMTLYQHIAQGQGMSETVQKGIVTLLKNQQVDDRLAKYLPKNIVVANKTGDLDNVRHDAGFITVGNTTYVIALLGKDIGTPQDGIEAEAQLSYIFYKHFIKQ